jgi:hypothetical protein
MAIPDCESPPLAVAFTATPSCDPAGTPPPALKFRIVENQTSGVGFRMAASSTRKHDVESAKRGHGLAAGFEPVLPA